MALKTLEIAGGTVTVGDKIDVLQDQGIGLDGRNVEWIGPIEVIGIKRGKVYIPKGKDPNQHLKMPEEYGIMDYRDMIRKHGSHFMDLHESTKKLFRNILKN